jgi:N-acetylneuraminic acid mutarotase
MLIKLESELRAALNTCVTGLIATARATLEGAQTDIAEERAKGLREVDARRAEFGREVVAMHKNKEAQEGRIELNIGGYRFQTSVQALRRVPHTFFDAYFSGRYAQDVCDDGSIFVDRDGEHFGHVLEYMHDGVVAVAEPGIHSSVSLLRTLKREFGFYCIELVAKQPEQSDEPEMAYVMGGRDGFAGLSCKERYDASSGQWNEAASMATGHKEFVACALGGELYVIGGLDDDDTRLSSVEKYTPSSDTWSVVAPLPSARSQHSAVAVGSAMYVMGGRTEPESNTADVLKFDSAQGAWSEMAPMLGAMHYLAACAVESDIYVFGGTRWQLGADQAFVFRYGTDANEWSTMAPKPGATSGHSVSVLDGLIYLVGTQIYGKEFMRFDPSSGAWSTLAPTLRRRFRGVSFVLGGCLYVAGGFERPTSVERYNVTTDTWSAVANMVRGRAYFAAATIGSAGPAEDLDLFDSLIRKATI